MSLNVEDLAQVSMAVHEAMKTTLPFSRNGMIVPGSYDPATATVSVMLCDTAVVFPGDQMQQPMIESQIPLLTTHLEDQFGPSGGELVHLIPIQGGYCAILYRTPNLDFGESMQSPQGERWIAHRNAMSGTVDSHIKLTNDGTSGDASGGVDVLGGSKLNQATASGHAVTLDDSTRIVSVTTADGLTHVLDDATKQIVTQASAETMTVVDGQANAISQVAPSIGLGQLFSSIPATQAAMRNSDVTTFESSLYTQRLTDLKNIATAMLTAMAASGVPSLPSAAAVFAEIAALAHIPVPSGSSITRISG